jgi:hypothetical protein
MPEPQKVVHLTAAQKRRKCFQHPLIDNIPPLLTAEYLDQLLAVYFATDKNSVKHATFKQELIVNYFRLLASVVARYLYHWPVSRRFLDEMISTGAETITRIITTLQPDRLIEGDWFRSLGGLIEGWLRFDIEDSINQLRGIAPAPRSTNHDQEKAGKRPIYGNVETNLLSEEIKNSQAYTDIDPVILEVKDTLRRIAQTDYEVQILLDENWGLSNAEVAEKLGKTPRWISTVRKRLRERYDELEKRTS